MKKITLLLLSICLIATGQSSSSKRTRKAQAPRASQEAPKSQPSTSSNSSGSKRLLMQALQLSQSGQYQAAAIQLFSLARRPEMQDDRAQIKYILGLMLSEMKLNQVAAFQFVDVIRTNNPKYTRLAIDKLAAVADELGDDTLINYAMSRVDVTAVPEKNRDMVQYRIGEIKMRGQRFEEAIQAFSKIGVGSRYYSQALFQRGLALMELGRPVEAVKTFEAMASARRRASVTDTNRVAAKLAIARALYQKKDWDGAIAAYAEVPRDHFLWHEAVYEQSWAMLRAARFRSVLSNFQTLHSPFYEDDYNPESLLLRSIVYLYICKYDEMEKVLSLYEKTYGPARSQISVFLSSNTNPLAYFGEIERWQVAKKKPVGQRPNLKIPYVVLNEISNGGSVRRSLNYLKRLQSERRTIETNPSLRNTALGRYALKVIGNRAKNTKISIGETAKVHMTNIRNELKEYTEQVSFVRYEMISAQKEVVKKRIEGTDLPEARIDDNRTRDFYVENGYQYYPFNGEYWLDEVGNYHFLGKSSCE